MVQPRVGTKQFRYNLHNFVWGSFKCTLIFFMNRKINYNLVWETCTELILKLNIGGQGLGCCSTMYISQEHNSVALKTELHVPPELANVESNI